MIQAKCIQKFRDKQNKIIGYRLQDINGQTQDVTPEILKKAIFNNQISVVNLTLTSDNRLVDSKEDDNIRKNIDVKTKESIYKYILSMMYNIEKSGILQKTYYYPELVCGESNEMFSGTFNIFIKDTISKSFYTKLQKLVDVAYEECGGDKAWQELNVDYTNDKYVISIGIYSNGAYDDIIKELVIHNICSIPEFGITLYFDGYRKAEITWSTSNNRISFNSEHNIHANMIKYLEKYVDINNSSIREHTRFLRNEDELLSLYSVSLINMDTNNKTRPMWVFGDSEEDVIEQCINNMGTEGNKFEVDCVKLLL